MASNQNNQSQEQGPRKQLPALYPHLLQQNANPATTITRAPVMYDQAGSARNTPVHAFQPRVLNRAQQPQQKNAKHKTAHRMPSQITSFLSSSPAMPTAEAPVGLKTTTFSEFTKNTANDDSYNPSQGKRHRGGRNKNKSKWPKPQYEEEEEPTDVDWDAVYVQGQPTSWNQWKTSSEKYRSVFEWKQKLKSTSFSSESRASEETPSDDPTAKRQRLSASITPHSTQRSTSSSEEPAMHAGLGATFPQIQPHTAQMTDNEHDASISQPQSSKLPGKAGFAKRMMEKMGHVKGQGLGPEGKGIIESLYTQTDKSRGRGGRGGQFGGANRTQIAVIKGGRRAKEEEDDPRDKPSPVIVIFGLLDGVTRGDDEARNDGGIRQEIGDYCKIFGILEKVSPVWGTGHAQAPVFVKFGSDIGAHVALDHFNDPTKAGAFQGKGTSAKFYNLEQFELGVYE